MCAYCESQCENKKKAKWFILFIDTIKTNLSLMLIFVSQVNTPSKHCSSWNT